MPGGSGVGQDLLATMPIGHSFLQVGPVRMMRRKCLPVKGLVWPGQVFYLPDGASLAPPPFNEESGVYSRWATQRSLSSPICWCKWRKKKHQLLSSPFSDVQFDPVVVARVQDNEHLASQQHKLSSVTPHGNKIKRQMRRVRLGLLSAPIPRPSAALCLAVEDPMASHLWDSLVSGMWSAQEQRFHINHQEIMAVFRTLQSVQQELSGMMVSLMSDNLTVVAYL
ncbi:hypothetical protein E2C01_010460 [Portunus trituberculatus]|uniref:Uncharacterized protein n=1 Tax=Portunus trituberculatus TaxID=210409 RepID=A0A5B7D8P4_PORTR|nr:hypothetical protein [Portunus trituberculatus]